MKKKISKKLKKPLIIGVVVLVFLVLAGSGVMFYSNKVLKHDVTTLDYKFKDVGQLVTQEWYGRMLNSPEKNDRKLFKIIHMPFTNSRLIVSQDVEVQAAVDFSKIKYKVSTDDLKITVSLPHSTIHKAYAVSKTAKIYLEEESVFNNIPAKAIVDMQDKMVADGKKQALDSGILKKADENAKIIIKQMIKANKATEDYKVVFKLE